MQKRWFTVGKVKRWLIFLTCLIPLALIGWWASGYLRNPTQKKTALLFKVAKGTIPITVVEKGQLEPKEVTQVTPKDMFKGQKVTAPPETTQTTVSDGGSIVTTISGGGRPASLGDLPITNFTVLRVVPKGTRVNQGDLVVEFDAKPVKDMIEQTRDELKTLRDSYELRLNNLRTQQQDLALQVDQARLALDRILQDYQSLWEEAVAGKVSEDSLQFQERLLQAKQQRVNLENVEREHRVVDIILKEYDLPPEKAIRKETKPKPKRGERAGPTAKVNVNGQEMEVPVDDLLSGLESFGVDPNQVASVDESGQTTTMGDAMQGLRGLLQAGNAAQRSGAAGGLLPKSSAYYPVALRSEPPEVVSKHLKPMVDILKNIEDRQKRLAQLAKYPQPLALYAPITGYLFHGAHGRQMGWWVRETELRQGASVQLNRPLIYVSNTADMKITINVSEDDISKVKKGQKARVTVPALRDICLNGEVVEVSEVPEKTNPWEEMMPGASSAGKYPVTVNLTESDPRLRPKTNAEVEILCQEIKDAIFVPREAVFKKEDKKICYVWDNGKSQEREVKAGKRNDHFIIIKEGLKEGDEVYLYNPFIK